MARPALRVIRRFPPPDLAIESRRTVRRLPAKGVSGWIQGLGLSVQLCDLSLGGFAIFSVEAFYIGTIHAFTFTVDGRSLSMFARAVHCSEIFLGVDHFVSGWEFSADTAVNVIRQFVEAATVMGVGG